MAREGLTCGTETSCGGWGRGERKEWTLLMMKRKIRKKKARGHEHSHCFLSRSQFGMNTTDFSY